MRKHNRRIAARWGSARTDKTAPYMGHYLTNNKSFQFAGNSLLRSLLRRI